VKTWASISLGGAKQDFGSDEPGDAGDGGKTVQYPSAAAIAWRALDAVRVD
jgi:hypothetical protein